jgi:hypothetical protein
MFDEERDRRRNHEDYKAHERKRELLQEQLLDAANDLLEHTGAASCFIPGRINKDIGIAVGVPESALER